jgi:hypothetical protein
MSEEIKEPFAERAHPLGTVIGEENNNLIVRLFDGRVVGIPFEDEGEFAEANGL